MHADDTNITARSSSLSNVEDSLNNELENIHQWLLSNKLTLNVEKNRLHDHWNRSRVK
jgi:hypothetical protein